MIVHPPTTFSRPGNAGHFNSDGVDISWQSESPRSINLRNWRPDGTARTSGPRKREIARLMAESFGGTWHFTPGYGCPGGWGADDLTPAQMVALADAFDATIVVYLYGSMVPADVPAEFDGYPVYRNTGGYYNDRLC